MDLMQINLKYLYNESFVGGLLHRLALHAAYQWKSI